MNIVVNKVGSLSGHQGAIYALEKGPGNGLIYSAGADKLITCWDLHKNENLPFQARFPASVYSICPIPELELLLAGTSTGSIHILDLRNKVELKILQLHTSPVFDIRCSIKHKLFFSVGGDGNFSVCSLDNLSLIRIKKLSETKLRQMDLNADESELAIACGDGRIILMSLPLLEEKKIFIAHELSTNAVKYHPMGKYLLSGGKDAYLKIWDTENDYPMIHDVPAHNFAIYKIAFSPDNKLFATASRDKTIKLWDTGNFEFLIRISKEKNAGHINSVNSIYWNDDPLCLVSAGDDRTLLIWKIQTI